MVPGNKITRVKSKPSLFVLVLFSAVEYKEVLILGIKLGISFSDSRARIG
jgi:hypothetical protein